MNEALITLYAKMNEEHFHAEGYQGAELVSMMSALALISRCVEEGILQPGPNWAEEVEKPDDPAP